jgi:hypothetical protein
MKKLILIFAGAFAVLILTCTSAQAQYLGCFDSAAVTHSRCKRTASAALTMMLVMSKGRLDVEMIRVFDQKPT